MFFNLANITFLFLGITFAQFAIEISIAPAALKQEPGKYEVTIRDQQFRYAKKGVRGLLYIPKFSKWRVAERPMLIFYHGSTRNKKYYRKLGSMKKRADKYGFVLLSMQNWWMLSGNDTSGINESRRATNFIVNALVKAGAIRSDAVYTIGFSAGGFTAMGVVLESLEDKFVYEAIQNKPEELAANFFSYAGFASIKGNFYHGVFHPKIDESGDTKALYKKLYKNKIAYLTLGGKRDARRVKKQVPIAREFLSDYLAIPVVFKQFKKEGHSFTESNFKPFWKLIEKRLK